MISVKSVLVVLGLLGVSACDMAKHDAMMNDGGAMMMEDDTAKMAEAAAMAQRVN